MVAINASEKKAILEKFPNVQMVRTMKHDSKRHHYYMVEERGPMRLLSKLRGMEPPKDNYKKRG